MVGLRRRLSRLVLAASLAAIVGVGVLPGVALADSETVCVYYTETAGSCITQYFDESGRLTETRFYVFWGNWYAQV